MKIHHFFKEHQVFVLFVVFTLVLFIKCATFIQFTKYFPLNIFREWKTYAMYIGVCGLISSFVFLTKWQWWIIIVSVILDIWLVGNLIYWRNYNDLLSVYSLEAFGNMHSIWDSVFIFLHWNDIVFPLLTLLLVIILVYFSLNLFLKKKKIFLALFCFIFFLICTLPQVKMKTKEYGTNLFSIKIMESWSEYYNYCRSFTPITYLLLQIKILLFESDLGRPTIYCSDLEPFIVSNKNDTTINIKDNLNLVFVIFESLETAVINSEILNQQITPNINKLLDSPNSLFADKVIDQTRSGKSIDGQFIINTGLLPIFNGTICYRYQYNYYYSVANSLQGYIKQMTIVDDGNLWNQNAMTKSLGYDSLFANNNSDYKMGLQITQNMPDAPYLIQVITLASHVPFKEFADSSTLIVPKDMPNDLANYIKSVNYTDYSLGLIFDNINIDSTIIVITADHLVFHKEKRDQFIQYCEKYNLNIPLEKPFVPLIIYSPEIKEKIIVNEVVYQMDIYPTLLHLLGRENYFWQGFGINLLDSTSKRKISPDEALRLSDAIIRNDFFRKIEH